MGMCRWAGAVGPGCDAHQSHGQTPPTHPRRAVDPLPRPPDCVNFVETSKLLVECLVDIVSARNYCSPYRQQP